MPTYFQLGRNSIEHHDSVYTHDPSNTGLLGFPRGKRQNIPVLANILARSDSSERLNLPHNVDSPAKRKASSLLMQERGFREQFDGRWQPLQDSSGEKDQRGQGVASLLQKKQTEEDHQLKIVVELLKSKGNKKCHFKLFKHIDKDRLLKSTIEQY